MGSRFRPAILDALKGYPASQFGRDLMAGLVVAAVALPLAIAFAIASGADPRSGLVTAIVAGLAAALLGGSRLLVTGPTGAFVVVLAGITAEFGFAKLLIATFLAGALLVLAGVFRLGQIIKFIPYPVTTGFTAGIAVVIFAGQLPDLASVSLAAPSPHPLEKAWQVVEGIGLANPYAIGIAVGTILVIQAMRTFLPRVPGPIVALAAATLAVHFGQLPVATVGERFTIPSSLPLPELPPLDLATIREMMPSAVTIALLGAIESLLAAVVADGMTRQRHDSNQELVGQGIANMLSPLFGGIAATGAIARTATNVQAGGRTPVAAITHAFILIGVLYLFAPYAALVPMPCLAGILAVVAWNMSERHRFLHILRMPRTDAGVMLATFLLTVAIDLTVAVMVGLLLAVAIFLHRMSQMTTVGSTVASGEDVLPHQRFREEDVPPGVVVYSIDGPFFFGAADQFQETLAAVAKPPPVVILRMRNVPYLDATGLNALESAIEGLRRNGSRVMVASIQNQPLDMMERAGTFRTLGDENLFRTTPDALVAARAHIAAPAAAPV